MDLAWNNLLTCDYERTRPGAPRLELDLYTRSLTAMPAAIRSLPEGTILHVDGLAGTASPADHGTAARPATAASSWRHP